MDVQGVFSVDVCDHTIAALILVRELSRDTKRVHELGLTRSRLAKDFGDRRALNAAVQNCVQRR